jgi:tRNA threonylcarbamoyl adenosine modification protein (Sua5/YciO/YrdC/YwlC family)
MATTFYLHPKNPQMDRIDKIVAALKGGAVMLYPTDTVYAIGCDLQHKGAIERIQRIKHLSTNRHLTLLAASLSNIATYAKVSDSAYRLMRHLIPGPFTFLLPATRVLPRLVLDPKRKTTGLRVPDHPLCQTLLATLGNPLISASARLPDGSEAEYEYELFDALENTVDLILQIDLPVDQISATPGVVSTVIDLTEDEPAIVRKGLHWEQAAAFMI